MPNGVEDDVVKVNVEVPSGTTKAGSNVEEVPEGNSSIDRETADEKPLVDSTVTV